MRADDGDASRESDLRDLPQDVRADRARARELRRVGAWRTQDEGTPIDAVRRARRRHEVDGVASLRDVLVRYSDQFVRVVTEKLLTYALGRGVEDQDMPLVRSIVRDAATDNYRFSSLVLGVVKSEPFQMNMKGSRQSLQQRGSSLSQVR